MGRRWCVWLSRSYGVPTLLPTEASKTRAESEVGKQKACRREAKKHRIYAERREATALRKAETQLKAAAPSGKWPSVQI